MEDTGTETKKCTQKVTRGGAGGLLVALDLRALGSGGSLGGRGKLRLPARGVPHAQDFDELPIFADAIDDTAGPMDDFPDRGFIAFGHYAAHKRELLELIHI
ncbi:MAG: hypothetical protein A2107_14310 [Verrucomicrobia bacterium GWF2_62_7]|nr:MAG: hypothetical protein A2107_14310 [Verrucomicrobia bacterium GWF2_62_7]